jgi:hypothetical protein
MARENVLKLAPFPADTAPEAAWVQIEIYRRMAPEKRLRQVLQLGDSLCAIVASGVRSRHPEFSEEQVKLSVARITLGEELFRKVYPDVTLPR